MRYTVRPLSDRTWLGSMGKEPTRFSAKWGDTLGQLGYEIDTLNGRDVVIEIDISETDLKLNGELRANAAPSSRAVVVAFETSKHGQLIYRCDRFYTSYYHQGPEWQHNVRAIALHLEAQRAQERWGVTGAAGGTYGGFKALPAGHAMPASHMTYDDGFALVAAIAYPDDDRSKHDAIAENRDGDVIRVVVRRAKANAHPDRRGGDHTLWNTLAPALAAIGAS